MKPTPSGFTDAVTEPLAIFVDTSDGTFLNPLPSPTNEPENEPLNAKAFTLPLTSTLPVNWEPTAEPVLSVSTLNPWLGDTDAVIEPDAILNASPVKAERGMLNNPPPSPCINEPLNEPVNSLALT